VLDAQNSASEVTFWDRVEESYNNPENIWLDNILFDSLNKKFRGINVFVNHSSTKLQLIWKKLNKEFNEARRK
jgi:hypothetical protein